MMCAPQQRGYYSSDEKDVIRQYFDFALLQKLHQKTGSKLSYFGLPSETIQDLKTWKPILGYIAAVERNLQKYKKMEQALITQFPEIRCTVHLGEIDRVILDNRGTPVDIGGQKYATPVSDHFVPGIPLQAWAFDVINLDYYGPFLPPEIPEMPTRPHDRANALRKLFDTERQDAFGRWVLLITVGTDLGNADIKLLKSYLNSAKCDASKETCEIIDNFLNGSTNRVEKVARLVHGAAALMIATAASNANLRVTPRGTVLYHGAGGHLMTHLAYEFEPALETISALVPRTLVLRAPMLKLRNPLAAPWFELSPTQLSDLNTEEIRNYLEFLEPDYLDVICKDS